MGLMRRIQARPSQLGRPEDPAAPSHPPGLVPPLGPIALPERLTPATYAAAYPVVKRPAPRRGVGCWGDAG